MKSLLIYDRLNEEQLKAVRHKKGPLLIIAGAGTGKTTVITERIKYLISEGIAEPSEILALTFTEKAAREMEERVDVSMPFGYTQMWISTFHSFCDRILRAEALHIGLDSKYKLMTGSESVQFIRNNLFKFELNYFRPLGNPTKFITGIIQHFSRLQDEDVLPREYLSWIRSKKTKLSKKVREDKLIEIKKWEELANAYKKYDELKVKESVLDFGDLIVKTLQLFRQRPNILADYKRQFKYILVDEFQDTNIAQNELVKLLAGPGGNITVVLDDDQSIYRFRGAAVSNALYFRKYFPSKKVVTLIKNYRSSKEILDKAYSLIQYNNPDRLEIVEKINKKLIAVKRSGNYDIKFIHKDRVENEADAVARQIKELVLGEKQKNIYKFKDVAILVRANSHSEPFLRALSRYGIPYQFLGPGRLFYQPEIIDLISYLKIINNFEDSASFFRLLTIEYFNIPGRDLLRLVNYAKRYNLNLFDACEKIEEVFVSQETRIKINKIISILERHFDLVKKESAGQMLYYFLQDTGMILKMINPDSSEAEKKAANISKFFDKLKTYEVDHEDATVPAVVDWIELSSELGESPLAAEIDWTDIDAVNILTVHSSKGLEFPVVFLVNLVSQRFPTIGRREQIPIPDELIKEVLPQGDYHIQEERRLFYVGMTRAMDKLFITAADYYGEGKREKKLSPFIFEALGDEAVSAEKLEESGEQLSFLDYQPPTDFSLTPQKELQKFHVDYLSYSQIETFRICPLHFKLKYIFKIPTPPTSSQSFGNSFHATMKVFYESVLKGNRPSIKLLYEILENNWIKEGYLSKFHETKSFEKAQKFLKHYFKNVFDPNVLPVATEQPFMIKLNDLKIGGKIDRVDLDGDKLKIIDYKTGSTPINQKQADNDLQFSIYALAATLIPEYPFNRKPDKVELSFCYFDPPQIITTKRTGKDLNESIKLIENVRKEIENSEFKCSSNILCESCEYKIFCKSDKN